MQAHNDKLIKSGLLNASLAVHESVGIDANNNVKESSNEAKSAEAELKAALVASKDTGAPSTAETTTKVLEKQESEVAEAMDFAQATARASISVIG